MHDVSALADIVPRGVNTLFVIYEHGVAHY